MDSLQTDERIIMTSHPLAASAVAAQELQQIEGKQNLICWQLSVGQNRRSQYLFDYYY